MLKSFGPNAWLISLAVCGITFAGPGLAQNIDLGENSVRLAPPAAMESRVKQPDSSREAAAVTHETLTRIAADRDFSQMLREAGDTPWRIFAMTAQMETEPAAAVTPQEGANAAPATTEPGSEGEQGRPSGEGGLAVPGASEDPTACRDALDTFMADRRVGFASGRAQLTPESVALIPDIVAILAGCPTHPVYVEGHTDSVGDEALNLALSVSRAEAVVDSLVEAGIAPERLFAVGYGESLPVASNDTQAGRMQNRRIVFAFEDQADPK